MCLRVNVNVLIHILQTQTLLPSQGKTQYVHAAAVLRKWDIHHFMFPSKPLKSNKHWKIISFCIYTLPRCVFSCIHRKFYFSCIFEILKEMYILWGKCLPMTGFPKEKRSMYKQIIRVVFNDLYSIILLMNKT